MKKEYKNVIKVVVGIYIFFISIGFFNLYLQSKDFQSRLFTIADRDTYVDSDNPTKNYAEEAWVDAGSQFTSQYYEAYFHFTLSDKPNNYDKAELSLALISFLYTPSNFSIILVGNSWQENTLTWNNKPAHQETIRNITITSEERYVIELTDFLRNLDEFSICVDITNKTIEESIGFWSSEGYVYDVDAPQIIWTYESEYSPSGLIALFLIYVLLIVSLAVVITKITKARVLKKTPIT